MNTQIIIVLFLNFIISMIGTLAYSVRLVGVRTGKIAISFALFNVLTLLSRTAVTFQAPLLTKFVEKNSESDNLLRIFYLIILISGLATVAGTFLIPTFQRILYRGVISFSTGRSVSRLLLHSFSKSGICFIKGCVAVPVKESITKLDFRKMPLKVVSFNLIAVSIITVGTLAPIYAGIINPGLRATCITLSSVINGFATIISAIIIDPQLSIMTDDVFSGKCSEEDFRTCVIGMTGSKVAGTFASLALMIPASYLIVFIAGIM